MIRASATALPLLWSPAAAWADHGGGLDNSTMSPLLTAFLWAGGAFLVGMALIAIVSVLTRRRPPERPDG